MIPVNILYYLDLLSIRLGLSCIPYSVFYSSTVQYHISVFLKIFNEKIFLYIKSLAIFFQVCLQYSARNDAAPRKGIRFLTVRNEYSLRECFTFAHLDDILGYQC